MSDRRSSLTGLRIITTAVYVPGPVAARLLTDMGAAVTKIEPLSGDPLALAVPGWYADLCRGIDVRRIDLKSPDGNAELHTLLADADVLITSSRPSSLVRLGLAWPSLQQRHPRLCHVAIVGYASPRQEQAGHDLTYQADAGLLTGTTMPRTLLADLAGAQRAVSTALELLLARERHGITASREVALSESADLFADPLRHAVTTEQGWLGGGLAAYNMYPAREGTIAVAALEPHFRLALARELDLDPENRDALRDAFRERTAEEWRQWALERGLPLTAVR